ncbi:tripartite motif-containing protein 16-like isoform X1 [Chanodichthys erythropterus]|uniref:tripartite motif-containing protein 16-like isoform X1 n=1 Tax=Chanodichthys erythropterus TaxID=933992 RepID=UPI00351F4F5B
MKFRVAVLLLLYKCLVFAPNVIFATEPAVSGLTCPLKICTDVLKELGATEKQLKDLEIRLAKSEAQTEEIKKEKQAQIEEIKKEKQAQIEEIKKEKQAQIEEIKQDLEIRLAKSEAQIEEIKKEKQDAYEINWPLITALAASHITAGVTGEDTLSYKDFGPRTRNDFLKYSLWITLDQNTVNQGLRLSEGNTLITGTNTKQSYPDHPDRFNQWPQVLCTESVSDRRSYWEIEWSASATISVAYKSMRRKGGDADSGFGLNDQSWSLNCYPSSYSFSHNYRDTDLPVKPVITRTVNGKNHYRVGVYVDHSAGILSFYSVSGDAMSLIHTFQTTFTKPLYPGFRLYGGSSVKLI